VSLAFVLRRLRYAVPQWRGEITGADREVETCLPVAGREDRPMQMYPYLSFNGQCEEAFQFYEQCLGGQLGMIFRYAGSPLADQVPAGWQDKVMHGSLTIGEQVLMGGDVAPDRYEVPKGFSLSLQIKNTSEAERVFQELAKDGRVAVPLGKTFWAARFGMVVDRFGIPWSINCEG
jgi:PhnB protein